MPVLDTLRPAAAEPAPVGDRPLQPAVPLLHAGGRVPLAAARGRAHVRGNRRGWPICSARSASIGCGSPAASRCCAATCPDAGRRARRAPVGARSGAHDQRRAARRRRGRPARRAGLHRLTVSLDTLRARSVPAPHAHRRASLAVLAGIEAARRAGFTGLKLDTVVTRGDNDDELVDLVEFAREHRRRSAVHRVHGRRRRHAVAARGRRLPRARCSRASTDHYGPIAPVGESIVGAGRAVPAAGRPDVRHHLVDDAAVLPDVRSRAAHGRRRAAALPLRAARHGPAAAAPRRRVTRDAAAIDRRRLGGPRRSRRRRAPRRARPRRVHSRQRAEARRAPGNAHARRLAPREHRHHGAADRPDRPTLPHQRTEPRPTHRAVPGD